MIPELLDDILAGRIDPGPVLDYETDLDGIGDAYAAMDDRRAIKSLVRVGGLSDGRLGAVEEIQIGASRRGGMPREPRPIWIVRAPSQICVRAA